jgi:hypothetical protein
MADESGARGDSGVAGTTRDAAASAPKPIDIEQLAEKVYRLALEDARMARERGARVERREEW